MLGVFLFFGKLLTDAFDAGTDILLFRIFYDRIVACGSFMIFHNF